MDNPLFFQKIHPKHSGKLNFRLPRKLQSIMHFILISMHLFLLCVTTPIFGASSNPVIDEAYLRTQLQILEHSSPIREFKDRDGTIYRLPADLMDEVAAGGAGAHTVRGNLRLENKAFSLQNIEAAGLRDLSQKLFPGSAIPAVAPKMVLFPHPQGGSLSPLQVTYQRGTPLSPRATIDPTSFSKLFFVSLLLRPSQIYFEDLYVGEGNSLMYAGMTSLFEPWFSLLKPLTPQEESELLYLKDNPEHGLESVDMARLEELPYNEKQKKIKEFSRRQEHAYKFVLSSKNILLIRHDLLKLPVDTTIRTSFLEASPDTILYEWLSLLQQKEASYQTNIEVNQTLFNLRGSRDGILGDMDSLKSQFAKLKAYLSDKSSPTYEALLNYMEPMVGLYYRQLTKTVTAKEAAHRSNNSIFNSDYFQRELYRIMNEPIGDILPTALLKHKINDVPFYKLLRRYETILNAKEELPTQTIKQALKAYVENIDLNTYHLEEVNDQRVIIDLIKKIAEDFPITQMRTITSDINVHSSWTPETLGSLMSRNVRHMIPETIRWLRTKGVNDNTMLRTSQSQQEIYDVIQDSTGEEDKIEEDKINALTNLLLMPGVKLEQKDEEGKTPLDLAIEKRLPKVIAFFLTQGAGQQLKVDTALEWYRELKRTHALIPEVQAILQALESRNAAFAWHMAMEHILPPVNRSQGDSHERLITDVRVDPLTARTEYVFKTATMGDRQMPQAVYDQLFDGAGNFKKKSLPGKRDVAWAEVIENGKTYKVYVKKNPEFPGLEYAVGELMRQTIGHGALYTELVNINGEPYLLSYGIQGPMLYDAMENRHILDNLDQNALQELMIISMLINPEDGGPANYIIEEGSGRIVSIDNDHAFALNVMKEVEDGRIKIKIEGRSALYVLDQMTKPINPSVIDKFNALDENILRRWLESLSTIHQQYIRLFTVEEQIRMQQASGKQTLLGIPFTRTTLQHLVERYFRLRGALRSLTAETSSSSGTTDPAPDASITPLELLKKINPLQERRYMEAHTTVSESSTSSSAGTTESILRRRFRHADGSAYQTQGGYPITTTTRNAFLSGQNIDPKKDLQKICREGRDMGPALAREELEEVIKEADTQDHGETLTAFNNLRTGDQKTAFLERLDFQRISLLEQSTWLEALRNHININQPVRLTLKNLIILTDDILARFISSQKRDFDNLTALIIQGSNLTHNSLKVLAAVPQLEMLDLSKSKSLTRFLIPIRTTAEPMLLNFAQLKHLILNCCMELRDINITAPKLRRLEAKGNPKLSNLKLNTTTLEHVDLSNNKFITDQHIHNIKQNNTKLINVKVSGSGAYLFEAIDRESLNQTDYLHLNKKIGAVGAIALAEALQHNITVRDINLSGNNIGYLGAKALAEALRTNTAVEKINLWGNNIGPDGIGLIANALKTNRTVQKIDLCRNNIGPIGIELIDNALNMNSTILEINLSNNNLGRKGAIALAKFLQNNRSVQIIWLWWNNIGSEGATALATALQVNTTVKYISLGKNNIGPTGAKALANTLRKNKTVQDIGLYYNPIGSEGAAAIASALKMNTTVHDIGLFNNGVDKIIKAYIEQCLRRNRKRAFEHETTSMELLPDFISSTSVQLPIFIEDTKVEEEEEGDNEDEATNLLIKQFLGRNIPMHQCRPIDSIPVTLNTGIQDYKIPDDYQDWQYVGLSIDGGGIRGIMPAMWIHAMETYWHDNTGPKYKIHQMFDYFGGTSIGGIAALSQVASHDGMNPVCTTQELVQLFTLNGRVIFPCDQGVLSKPYNPKPLERLLQSNFGNLHLTDVLKPVVITSAHSGKDKRHNPYIFKSYDAYRNANLDYPLSAVARATSAAPGYFSAKNLETFEGIRRLFDGGLVSNNPAEFVLKGIKKEYGVSEKDIAIVSLGTGVVSIPESVEEGINKILFSLFGDGIIGSVLRGTIDRMPESGSQLRIAAATIEALMQNNTQRVHNDIEDELRDRYWRIQPTLKKSISLSDAGEDNIGTLVATAEEWERYAKNTIARSLAIQRRRIPVHADVEEDFTNFLNYRMDDNTELNARNLIINHDNQQDSALRNSSASPSTNNGTRPVERVSPTSQHIETAPDLQDKRVKPIGIGSELLSHQSQQSIVDIMTIYRESKQLGEHDKLNTSIVQRLSFEIPEGNGAADTPPVVPGLYPDYISCPTVGDGDCFFHAVFTQPDEGTPAMSLRAADMRAVLCDAVQRGEYIDHLRPLVYEHYLELFDTSKKREIPKATLKLIEKNNRHIINRNRALASRVIAQLPDILQPDARYSVAEIQATIPEDHIKAYMERFRAVGGNDSYISFRPGDIKCPAAIIAKQNNVRVNIFTFNQSTGNLDLVKSVGNLAHTPINILHAGLHFLRLYNSDEGPSHANAAIQIMNNYRMQNGS